MPSYDYRCEDCGSVQEVSHKITETPEVECDKCGSKHTKRLLSASAFHLKGSGWYKTDYASKSDSGKSGSDSGKSKAESKKTDSKPAEKKDASAKAAA